MFELKPCNNCPAKTCAEATGEICPFDKPFLNKIEKTKSDASNNEDFLNLLRHDPKINSSDL